MNHKLKQEAQKNESSQPDNNVYIEGKKIQRAKTSNSLKKIEENIKYILEKHHLDNLLFNILEQEFTDINKDYFSKTQAKIIKLLFSKGTKLLFSKNNMLTIPLDTLKYLKDTVKDSLFPADCFLRSVVLSHKDDVNPRINQQKQNDLTYELTKFALDKGANPNTIYYGTAPVIRYVKDPKTYELLKNTFESQREDGIIQCKPYEEASIKLLEHVGLTKENFYEFAQKMEQSFTQTKNSYISIPNVVNYVWLTKEKKPKEISSENLKKILENHDFLTKEMSPSFDSILWTNEKKLIPKSVKFLEKNGIKVNSISDHQNEIKLYNEVINLIKKGEIIKASDVLRYSILESNGGIYADINYKFLNNFIPELKKYDFYINSFGNSFFFNKPHHPILENEVDLLKELLNKKNNEIYESKSIGKAESVMLTTGISFAYNIMKHANSKGNVDFANPRTQMDPSKLFHEIDCELVYVALYSSDMTRICSNPDTVAGKDGHSEWYINNDVL